MTIPMYSGTIPYVTTEQMIEVDRAMMEDVRIELIQMMATTLKMLVWTLEMVQYLPKTRGNFSVV